MSGVRELFSLDGRVALVSGASRGIGHALAGGLAEAGARVVGLGRSAEPADAGPARWSYRTVDVCDPEAFARVCAEVYDAHGRLDVYVHAAGISLRNGPDADLLANFTRTVETNLTAAYACSREAAEHMGRSGGGSIVHVTSIGSFLGFPGNPGYVASKGGLRLLARAMAVDLAPRGIRVNTLAPGYIRTEMTEESYQDPVRFRERCQRTLLDRWGTPADLVGAAIFLASDASSYVTGQDLVVDGGWTAKGL